MCRRTIQFRSIQFAVHRHLPAPADGCRSAMNSTSSRPCAPRGAAPRNHRHRSRPGKPAVSRSPSVASCKARNAARPNMFSDGQLPPATTQKYICRLSAHPRKRAHSVLVIRDLKRSSSSRQQQLFCHSRRILRRTSSDVPGCSSLAILIKGTSCIHTRNLSIPPFAPISMPKPHSLTSYRKPCHARSSRCSS